MGKKAKSKSRGVSRSQNALKTKPVAAVDPRVGIAVAAPQAIAEPIQIPANRRQSNLRLVLCAALMALTFAVYLRAIVNPFINFDDQEYVYENTHVQEGLTAATIRWAFTTTDAVNWHPLTWLSHALDCQLYGLKPAGHHLTSIILHTLNVGLLFLMMAIGTGKMYRSLAVAALFALHPMNVESVAWIAERKSVLSMFFLLLAVGAYGWYVKKPRIGRYSLVAIFFALGLMAKPMIVTLPFALLLLDIWPLRRAEGMAASTEFPVPQFGIQRLVLEKLPFLLLSAGSSFMTMVAQQAAIAPNQSLAFLARILNSIYAYPAYITKALLPIHLAAFYPYEGMRMQMGLFTFSLVLLVAACYWIWRRRTSLYAPVGWFWFLGTLVPMIGIVQVGNQAMADRYAYLPLIGIFWIFVWTIADFAAEKNLSPRLLAIPCLAVLLVCVSLTWRQIGYWRTSFDLWNHALQVTRDNYIAEDYVGTAILNQVYEATGQRYSEEAAVHFRNAVRINPSDAISHLNFGAYLHERGKFQEAIEQYQKVLELTRDPHLTAKSWIDLGAAYHQMGDYATARDYYRKVLQVEPGNRVVFTNLGKLAMDERISHLAASASAHPTAEAYLQLGQLQQAASHLQEARASFQIALKINPKLSEAQSALQSISTDVQR